MYQIANYVIEYKPTANAGWHQLDSLTNKTIEQVHSYMRHNYHAEIGRYERNGDKDYIDYFYADGRERYRVRCVG